MGLKRIENQGQLHLEAEKYDTDLRTLLDKAAELSISVTRLIKDESLNEARELLMNSDIKVISRIDDRDMLIKAGLLFEYSNLPTSQEYEEVLRNRIPSFSHTTTLRKILMGAITETARSKNTVT